MSPFSSLADEPISNAEEEVGFVVVLVVLAGFVVVGFTVVEGVFPAVVLGFDVAGTALAGFAADVLASGFLAGVLSFVSSSTASTGAVVPVSSDEEGEFTSITGELEDSRFVTSDGFSSAFLLQAVKIAVISKSVRAIAIIFLVFDILSPQINLYSSTIISYFLPFVYGF